MPRIPVRLHRFRGDHGDHPGFFRHVDRRKILPLEPYVPTLEELQAAKKREISQACETAIYSGVDVKLSDGSTEHFALTEHDQLNLFR